MNSEPDQKTFCIDCTLPYNLCICSLAPKLPLDIDTHILFHPRELHRRNSSGRLLKHCLNIPSSQWHRLKNADQAAQFQGYALLYPDDNKQNNPNGTLKLNDKDTQDVKGYLWLDATWQESRKMMRQSPWLDALPKYAITSHLTTDRSGSQYKLRRNQTKQGLSTMETFACWLGEQNQAKSAQDLLNFFNLFQNTFLNARNSGLFK